MTTDQSIQHHAAWVPSMCAAAAVAVPALIYAGRAPLPNLPNDLLAAGGWGIWLAGLASTRQFRRVEGFFEPGLAAMFVLGILLFLCATSSAFLLATPLPIMARHAAAVGAALLVLFGGASLMREDAPGQLCHRRWVRAVLAMFVIAGVGNAAVAVLQFAIPDNTWAPLNPDGRAAGHLRQPNLLATQLLMAGAAAAGLHAIRRLPTLLFVAVQMLLSLALALTLSRVGVLGALVLALWGLLDRRLAPVARRTLLLLPLLIAACWWAALALGEVRGLHGDIRGLADRTRLSSTRWLMWAQVLSIIQENPWVGVGMGQFNLAWTLTRPDPSGRGLGELFTHAHNLFLHWAVENGLPAAILLTGLLLGALWRATRLSSRADGDAGVIRRTALVIVALVLVHSQLEFPLWYMNFLLPTACCLGMALAPGASAAGSAPANARFQPQRAVGGLLVLAALGVLLDYQPVDELYAPPNDGRSQEQRIERARSSLLFGHFGERYMGTLAPAGQRTLQPFREIVYEQLDLPLLYAWTLAYAESGDRTRAQYLAARLREFEHPSTVRFFAACNRPDGAPDFPCGAPAQGLTFRDFRR